MSLSLSQRIWEALGGKLRPTYVANVCGHETKLKGYMKCGEDGPVTILGMPLADNGSPDYCLECIGKMTIKCAWCSGHIVIGSPVTLYSPKEGFKVPEHAVRYTENGANALVGCLGWECAMSGADMCGHWLPPGKVERCLSPLELCLLSVAQGDPSMVIVDDTSNYPASATVHPLNKCS